MSSLEDIQIMIDKMDPIPLVMDHEHNEAEIFSKEFEEQLKYDFEQINKEYNEVFEMKNKCINFMKGLLQDFAMVDETVKYRKQLNSQYFMQFLSNLPEILSVKKIAKVNYTVYSFEYIDNLIDYYNLEHLYSKECALNTLNMSEQTKKNFYKRIGDYMDRYIIKKKVFVIENPIDLYIELDMTNNEIIIGYCKSSEMHEKMREKMLYVDVDVKIYVSDINITYTILHMIWFKNVINMQIIEQILLYYANNTEYQNGKIFTKKQVHYLVCNFTNIIKYIRQMKEMRYKIT